VSAAGRRRVGAVVARQRPSPAARYGPGGGVGQSVPL